MNDRGAPGTQLSAAVLAAAEVLASTFHLGDRTRPATTWPVGEGDAVIAVTLAGGATGTLLLAVSDDVAGRLTTATDVLTAGMTAAVAALGSVCGLPLVAEEVGAGSGLVPDAIVEILDAGTLTALVGLILPVPSDPGGDAGGDPAADGEPGQYEPASFGVARPTAPAPHAPMSLLHDVEMVVTAELGRTTMPVRELLALTPGMVVEIDRAAGAPIDLLVNGKLIAAGEVVVIDEEFGIRITEIAPAGERT